MKALIIEDEILASKHLLQVLDEVGDISVIAVLESITETIEWFGKILSRILYSWIFTWLTVRHLRYSGI